jgi:methylenetetrahydrofolate reductase (NADPH)
VSRLRLSLEVFPPREPSGDPAFRTTLAELAALPAAFCSVTYGAGGSNAHRTDRIVRSLAAEGPFTPAGHLTCVGESRRETNRIARRWAEAGVRRIVALRGDMPEVGAPFVPHAHGYTCVPQLIAGLREVADFDISVGCYPEGHPESTSQKAELEHLRRKLEAGAARAISQYFFDVDTFLRFRDRVARSGIEQPIVAGIMPIGDIDRVVSFSRRCGATVPSWVVQRFAGLKDETERTSAAIEIASQMCLDLAASGVENVHLYTLNRADLTLGVCRAVGLIPELELAA